MVLAPSVVKLTLSILVRPGSPIEAPPLARKLDPSASDSAGRLSVTPESEIVPPPVKLLRSDTLSVPLPLLLDK